MNKLIFTTLITIFLFSCSSKESKSEEEKKTEESDNKNLKNPALQNMMDDLNADDTNLSDLEDGFHELKYPNGNMKSTGTISNGKKEGLWTYFRENGLKWSECEFLNGKPNGKVVSYHTNEKIYYIGYFTNGEKTGNWMFYDENSNLIKEENLNKQ